MPADSAPLVHIITAPGDTGRIIRIAALFAEHGFTTHAYQAARAIYAIYAARTPHAPLPTPPPTR